MTIIVWMGNPILSCLTAAGAAVAKQQLLHPARQLPELRQGEKYIQ